jgi:hypothetical protein
MEALNAANALAPRSRRHSRDQLIRGHPAEGRDDPTTGATRTSGPTTRYHRSNGCPPGPGSVEGTLYRGYEEVARGLESLWQTWEDVSFEETDARDLDDVVLWLGRLKLRGAASQVELDREFALCFVLREGKLARIQSFIGWQQALEAAGLTD